MSWHVLLSPVERYMVGSLKMNTTLEYSTRVVQEGDRRCKKSTLNDLAYLTPLRIPLMNPVLHVLYAPWWPEFGPEGKRFVSGNSDCLFLGDEKEAAKLR